ncbi:MAG: hypothetical protein KAS07_01295 [Candidatus Pacebacteria bacterium]|nr:hypothetical protein [Candidatus Paceibacterota bacterium]
MLTKKTIIVSALLLATAIGGGIAAVKARSSSDDPSVSSSGEAVVQEASTKKGEGGLPSEAEMIKLFLKNPYGHMAGYEFTPQKSKKMLEEQEVVKLVSYTDTGITEEPTSLGNRCVIYNYEGCFEFTEAIEYKIKYGENDQFPLTGHSEKGEKFCIVGFHNLCEITINGEKIWKDMKTGYLFEN